MTDNSFTFKLNDAQSESVISELNKDVYEKIEVPYTQIAAKAEKCTICLYSSGKLLIQGKGALDWINFTLEPQILKQVVTGYDDILQPDMIKPHIGIDESGKGDFFGPMVIAAVYVNESFVLQLRDAGVKDSKSISSDKRILEIASEILRIVGDRHIVINLKPPAFNRLYRKMKNINRVLAWGHARALEDLLVKVPECPRAVADKFGPENRIKQALMQRGRNIELVQRTKAEDDPAVAAASILARAEFVRAMQKGSDYFGFEIPKGVSTKVKEAAERVIKEHGPEMLPRCAKINFKTTDEVLALAGFSRDDLPEETD